MKVYIVVEMNWENSKVVGVYEKLEDVLDFVKCSSLSDAFYKGGYDIQQHEVR